MLKRTRAGCISCGTNTYRVFGAETGIHIVTIHIECFVQTNDMTVYSLEMKLYHTISCRNEIVREAYHAGQTSIECLVNTYRAFRADKSNDSILSRDEIISYRIVSSPVVSCLVLPCLVWSGLVLSYRVVSCRVVSCRVLSCLVLSCLVLQDTFSVPKPSSDLSCLARYILCP